MLGLTFAYMLAEAIGGFLTNSLALLSDAGHMLADVASLVLAMLALWFSSRPANAPRYLLRDVSEGRERLLAS